jgi:prepilin-type processing-associated H-X9-DG protein
MLDDTVVDGYADFFIRPFDGNNDPRMNDSIGSIHRGGANVLFCDGHVAWYPQKDLTIQPTPVPEDAHKQRMWNTDNEPARPW